MEEREGASRKKIKQEGMKVKRGCKLLAMKRNEVKEKIFSTERKDLKGKEK